MTTKQQQKEFDILIAYMKEHFPIPKWILEGKYVGYFYNMN